MLMAEHQRLKTSQKKNVRFFQDALILFRIFPEKE